MFEFGSGIIDREVPNNAPLFMITISRPWEKESRERRQIRNAARAYALSAEGGELNLSDIKPTAMLRCIVNFQSAGQGKCFLRRKSLVKNCNRVSIEVIHDQHNLFGVRLLLGQQPVNLPGPVQSGTMFLG